jgi:hypothetical protein
MRCRRRIAAGEVVSSPCYRDIPYTRLDPEQGDGGFKDRGTVAGHGILGVSVQVRPAEIQGVRHAGRAVVGDAKQFESKREPIVLRRRLRQLDSPPPDQLGSFQRSLGRRHGRGRATVPGRGAGFADVNGHHGLQSAGGRPA